jgi:CHAT domain-containing protein/tetratricopeptide (TPR) repeat protein
MPQDAQNTDNSLSVAQRLNCPSCGREFEADLWLIVDAGQRLDLVERVRAGQMHELTCLNCGQTGQVDAPLLVYRPDAEPPILFSSASQTSGEQDRGQAGQLVGMLQESLGDAWQDQWLVQGLPVVPRHALPAVLSDDGEGALCSLQDEATAQIPPELRAVLQELAAERIEIRSSEDLQRVLAEWPDRQARLAVAVPAQGGVTVPAAFQADIERAEEGEHRYVRTGDQAALDAAADVWRRIMDDPALAALDERFQVAVWNNSAIVLARRYGARGRLADLSRALELWQQAVSCTPPDSPELPRNLNNLGNGLRSRYAGTGRLEDLQEAIRVSQQAVARTPPDSPDLPMYLNNLGNGLRDRYAGTGRLEDLEEAIRGFQQAVARTPLDSRELPRYLNNVGAGLCDRYARTGRLEDLEEAIRGFQQAVARTPPPPDLPMYLNNLGRGLSYLYARTGRLEDLEEAIWGFQQAVARAPLDSPELPRYLNNLGAGLCDRYARTGRLEDLEEAIRLYEQAVARTPLDSPDLPCCLNNMGNGLHERYARTGRLEDLEEAIRGFQQAVARTPPDSPDLPCCLNNMGNGLHSRYARTGRLEDLEEAIRGFQQAVARTPPDSADLPMYLNNLGTGLRDRYARTGRLEDIEEAIRGFQQAVAHTPPDSPDLPGGLNNVGIGLCARYARTGRLEDLEEAIRGFQQAVAHTPPDALDLPLHLNSLANDLHSRYARTGRLEDLEEAIRGFQQAVARTLLDSPDLPMYLNNLGAGLRSRYARTGRLEDLEEAIRVYQQAVVRTPPDSPELPARLNNLGNGLSSRYAHTARLEDLEEAIRVYQQAVARTPPDSPDLPSSLNNLGTGLSHRYACTGRLEDLEEGRRVYERAHVAGLELAPEESLRSARNWSGWAFERAGWGEAATAYRGVFAAVDRLLRQQVLQSGKESWLREGQGLAGRAAYALARDGRPKEAVVALEQGRVRLLAETLEYTRRDLELLPEQGHADAYRRFRDAAAAVQILQQPDRPGGVSERFDRHQAIQTARIELDAAITAIRDIAGFEDFLVTPTWDRIQQTVKPEAPLVYLVTTAAGSLALIVRNDSGRSASSRRKDVGHDENGARTPRPDGLQPDYGASVQVLWLDAFHDADLNNLLVKRSDTEVTGGYLPGQLERNDWLRASLDEALPELGTKLMGPLAAALQVDLDASMELHGGEASVGTDRALSGGRDLPGIVLVPTGRLSLLPLHAARYVVDGGDVCFLDAFAVSYAISAMALANARQEAQARTDTQLCLAGVGNPLPESARIAETYLGSLPFARAELESIADILPRGAVRVLYERNATRQSLLDALPGAGLIHLSCHGRFRADDPLDSGLLLADGELTLRDIIAAGFTALRTCRLAVLSACQTAIQDFAHLPDEAIGLPAGLTQAGVPSVVGTLWSVSDASTALLMVRFYELLLQDKLAPPEALRRAQLWLRDATNADLDAYLSQHEALALARQEEAERMPLSAVHTLLGPVLKGDPDVRPYAHQYYWAPFIFYGAEAAL